MMAKPTFVMALVAGVAGVTMVLLVSCSTPGSLAIAPLEIPGAHFVGNQACSDCHAEVVRHFPGSPHARLQVANAALHGFSGCESCHGPGSRHIEFRGATRFIINPGKDPKACFACHLEIQARFNLPQHHPVIEGRMNCVACHDPHGGDIFKF